MMTQTSLPSELRRPSAAPGPTDGGREHAAGPVRDPGSFRDPAGGVFHRDGRIFRVLGEQGATDYRALAKSPLHTELVASDALIPTRELAPQEASALGFGDDAVLVLEHERIPFVSYSYEWPFELLRVAALQFLASMRLALNHGFQLKDATPFNTQFRGTEPVVIDVSSFERLIPGRPWAAYSQFTRTFLNPLLLQALTGEPYQPWLRAGLEGIAPEALSARLPWRRKLRRDVFTHVVAQAWMAKRFSGDVNALRRASEHEVPLKTLHRLIDQLERSVDALSRPATRTAWSHYEDDCHYANSATQVKRKFVSRFLGERRPSIVWDVGCNAGEYSALAAQNGAYVVAIDGDDQAVGRVVSRPDAPSNRVLPLVMDLLNPSPDQGWAQSERRGLQDRGPADMALALALVHHLSISGGVPLDRIVSWLAAHARSAVIEFVPLDDPMAQRLLATRLDTPAGYDEPTFRRALEASFEIDAREVLPDSGRVLYAVSR
jgi:hypothetical protein